jgi:hypothetical protein
VKKSALRIGKFHARRMSFTLKTRAFTSNYISFSDSGGCGTTIAQKTGNPGFLPENFSA